MVAIKRVLVLEANAEAQHVFQWVVAPRPLATWTRRSTHLFVVYRVILTCS